MTWNWTPVFQAIGKHSNHYANGPIYIYTHTHIHQCWDVNSHISLYSKDDFYLQNLSKYFDQTVKFIRFFCLDIKLYANYIVFEMRVTFFKIWLSFWRLACSFYQIDPISYFIWKISHTSYGTIEKRIFKELFFIYFSHYGSKKYLINFGIWNSGKNILCILCTDFLEFVAAKFNLELAFVQFFNSSYWLQWKIYIIYFMF